MSADNWGVCPKCFAVEMDAYNKRLSLPSMCYAKVSAEEYLKAVEQSKIPPKEDNSLREDYEIGCEKTGKFYVIYSCSCSCGFSFEYRHDQVVAHRVKHRPP